ncbi:hypothetical protein KCU83_g8814, partial [Aureobasidium melanogenum]
MKSIILTYLLAGLVTAAPRPQDIDFDLAYAVPNPTYSEAIGATAQSVVINPSVVYSAAAAQITDTVADTAGVATATAQVANQKRAACASQPTYDVNLCASKCNAITGCISINIYFEGDPTVDPGSGNSGCANPPSTTTIKCVFWGGPLSFSDAVNTGQWRNQFQVVIAGSNGYTSTGVPSIPGYGSAIPLGNAAINAPYDSFGFNSYMGRAIFVGAFDAQLCADACAQKSQYALANPPTDGSPIQTCQFFNTYILYINTTKNIQGQYCAMYSESWPASYATNVGQYQGNDHFLISYSYAYSNQTNPGSACKDCAVHQASAEVTASSLQPYCSSILGYTALTATATNTVTTTPLVTITATVTTTIAQSATVTDITTVLQKRQDTPASSQWLAVSTSDGTVVRVAPTAMVARRDLSTPGALKKYPSGVVSSACSLVVQSPSVASATTTITTTITAPTATNTITASASTTTTFTQTVSATTTSTTSIPDKQCGSSFQGNNLGFTYDISCNINLKNGGILQTGSARSLQDSELYLIVRLSNCTSPAQCHITPVREIPNAKIVEEDGSESFLLNAYGLKYGEITASSLVKVDYEGKTRIPVSPVISSVSMMLAS